MIIPRAPGDLESGKKIYNKECFACHGKDGMGRGKFPRLVGQYSNYLMRQMTSFVKGERSHDEVEMRGILNELKAQDLQDILAYLTLIQSGQP